jgi:queuine tRNA-ribosyltransferase
VFTRQGIINLRNKKWERDFSPLDEELTPNYSKAYMRHLTRAKEHLAAQIASEHNLKFYLWLVREARKHILADTFVDWKPKMIENVTRRL